jgi:hypothetical protein
LLDFYAGCSGSNNPQITQIAAAPLRRHEVAGKKAHDTILNMKNVTPERVSPQSFVGTVHRFGENGVLYEVVRPIDDSSVMIRVLDTGEETEYPVSEVRSDPVE